MTLQEMSEKEQKLNHACSRVITIEPDGRQHPVEVHHYLTCVKCKYRKILGLPYDEPDHRKLPDPSDTSRKIKEGRNVTPLQ